MRHTYRLELDSSYKTCTEVGWAKARFLRDVRQDYKLPTDSNLFFERNTGTLMLKPLVLDPVARYGATNDSLRISASSLISAAAGWEEVNSSEGLLMRSKLGPSTLIQSLVLMAYTGVQLEASRHVYPILRTQSDFAINEGVIVMGEMYSSIGHIYRDWLSIGFGDFLLSIHSSGESELWWSADGSCNSTSYKLKKQWQATTSKLSIFGAIPSSRFYVMILPFGRGNILFQWQTNNMWSSAVYTHKEAEWNAGEERYRITQSGPVTIYTNVADQKNLGLRLSKIGFAGSGCFVDDYFNLPYAPSVTPETAIGWTKTMGTPSVVGLLYDGGTNGEYVADGVSQKCGMKLALAGNGLCSPFVDTYQIIFPQKVETVVNDPFELPAAQLVSLNLHDGDNWNDQRMQFVVRDRPSMGDEHTKTAGLKRRGRFAGRLFVDDQPYAMFEADAPKIVHKRTHDEITIEAKNFGVARATRKKWFWPQSFDGLTHPDAVRATLMYAGWPTQDIVTEAEDVKLAAAVMNGQGVDTKDGEEQDGKTDVKNQPQLNSSVADWLEYIRTNYSGWPLRYEADQKWYYQHRDIPTAAVLTLRSKPENDGPGDDRDPFYTELSEQTLVPETNFLMVVGETDAGEPIGNIAICPQNIYHPAADKPPGFCGEVVLARYVDRSLNTLEVLDYCLEKLFDAGGETVTYLTFKAPFYPEIRVGLGVAIEGYGLLQITEIRTEADSIRKLERTASTTYTGMLTGPSSGRVMRNAPLKFLGAIGEKTGGLFGLDINTVIRCTAQSSNATEAALRILRANIDLSDYHLEIWDGLHYWTSRAVRADYVTPPESGTLLKAPY